MLKRFARTWLIIKQQHTQKKLFIFVFRDNRMSTKGSERDDKEQKRSSSVYEKEKKKKCQVFYPRKTRKTFSFVLLSFFSLVSHPYIVSQFAKSDLHKTLQIVFFLVFGVFALNFRSESYLRSFGLC